VRHGAPFLTLCGLALLALHGWRLWFYTEDDAYIVARYARNLAHGHGFVYNAGEREWGCTTTLLPLLQAPLFGMGIAPLTSAKFIGLLSAMVAAMLAVRLAARHAPQSLAALAVLPVAAFGPLALWAVAGLETALCAALVLAAITVAVEERERARGRFVPFSAVLLVLATLARPDAPLYAPAVVIAGFNPARPRWLVRWTVSFVIGFLAIWICHVLYYQATVPNTLSSKVLGIAGRLAVGANYLLGFAREIAPLLSVTGAALVVLLIQGPWSRRQDVVALGAALLLSLAYPVWTGGDWMPQYRFFAPLVLFAAPLVVWAVAAIAERCGSWRQACHAAGALGIVLVAYATFARSLGWGPRLHVLRTANDLFLRLGDTASGGDPALTYAIADIGGFGWSSGGRILDLSGLVERSIAARPHGLQGPHPMSELRARRPEVVLVFFHAPGAPDFWRDIYGAVVKLESAPLDQADVARIARYPRTQPDAEALAYLSEEGDYQLVSIALFPAIPQGYLVFVRRSALDRVPRGLRSQRIGASTAYLESNRRERGIAMLRADLDANPYDEFGMYRMAQCLSQDGMNTEARGAISRLLQLNPRHAGAYFLLGTIEGSDQRLLDAVAAYRRCVRLDPDFTDAYNNLGFSLGVLGRYREAVPALEQAVRLRPDYALARANLAWVKSELARSETGGDSTGR
jgi:tetratricopeptide (TPR) repeat protein